MDRARDRRRWIRLAKGVWLLVLSSTGLVLGAGLLDRVVMPWVVRHGADTIVPSLTGRPIGETEILFQDAQLQRGVVQEVSDPFVPAGEVVSQEPHAGAQVRRGRAVHLLVSKGPPIRQVSPLAGMTLRHARIELAQRGLQPGEISLLTSSGRPDGEILATSPGPGEFPGLDGRVDLLVSGSGAGNLYVMPDFHGIDWREAASRLRAVDVRVSHRGGDVQVSYQDPSPGEPLRAGTTVLLN